MMIDAALPRPSLLFGSRLVTGLHRTGLRSLGLALALGVMPCAAGAGEPNAPPAIDPSVGKVEVTLDLPKDKPYVGEMIMLRMRSFIRADVALDTIVQPPLTNFDSQQLGRDKPIQAMVDGFDVAGFERDVAIFPQQAGRLVIDPFVRSVTIVTDNMQRVKADFASKPVFVDVQNHDAVNPPGTWWLPAKSVTVTDTWSVPPDEIKPGTLARRIVTIEAVGLTADRLPPPPDALAPGTIAFKGPATRDTLITPDGPVARASYQWDIRPVSGSPARLPAISIPWFDTVERHIRIAAIPDIWVAYVGTLVHSSHEPPRTWRDTYLSRGPMLAGVAGFAWTGAVALLLLRGRRRTAPSKLKRALKALDRAARFHDEPRFDLALRALADADPARWALARQDQTLRDALLQRDRARFAREGGPTPSLVPIAAEIHRLMERRPVPLQTAPDGLPPLDGPLGPSQRGRFGLA
jgi:hypothetical protein